LALLPSVGRFKKIVTARFLVDANAKTKTILRLVFQSSKTTIKEKNEIT
jgi:hypothetical protein